MTRNGKPPIKAVNIGPPIIPQNPATKEYVDNIPIQPPPNYIGFGTMLLDRIAQGYIPNGVNTTYKFSLYGGLLYKDIGNELPNTPVRANFNIRQIRLFFHSISQNEAIIEITFYKNDVEFERFEFTIPSGSRNSNVVNIPFGILEYVSGEFGHAEIKISGAIAANFVTITMLFYQNIDVHITPLDTKDTAMQVKDTAKNPEICEQKSPGPLIKIKTISERLLSIFR